MSVMFSRKKMIIALFTVSSSRLDRSRSALIIDLDNDGDQDFVITTNRAVLLMENTGSTGGIPYFIARATLPVESDIVSIAAADYDNDGNLDIFACVYHSRYDDPAAASSSLLALAFENSTGDTSSSDDSSGDTSSLFIVETAEVDNRPLTGNRWPRARAVDSVMASLGRESGSAADTTFEFDGIGDELLEDLVVAQL